MNRSDMGKQVKEVGVKKEAPKVVKKMGYSGGGLIKGKIKARGIGAATQGYSFKAS
tara:strand:- start:304 stop:471 length:168 start_codon:yes stop_codon:yes gene_type:complete